MENVQKVREFEKLAKEDVKNINKVIEIRKVLPVVWCLLDISPQC
jgi:hypothetical protein